MSAKSQQMPHCAVCRKTFDLSGWHALDVVGVGTFGTTENGRELATGATQTRRCECGDPVMLVVHFPFPVDPTAVPFALALALASTDPIEGS